MSPAHRAPFSLRRWLALLFRQPPQGLYRRPCLYQSGDRMEIEHYEAILAYDETRLRLQLPRGHAGYEEGAANRPSCRNLAGSQKKRSKL